MISSVVLESLMERYADGDIAAFDALYEALLPSLLANLRRWLHTDDRVQDALQIAWLKLHASRMRYRRGAPVVPWIMTIARNAALDQLRANRGREHPLEDSFAAKIPDDRAAFDWSEEDEREVIFAVRSAIDQLPAPAREVVRLHKLEGRPMSEVAEILGIKEGAARVRAHRGYKALGRLLLGFRARKT
jgi:RNA polymerase sigma-70 factor, ECF subfamily